ncbi:hypothetical protein RFI_37438, partial [Reticulomyxa filosa]
MKQRKCKRCDCFKKQAKKKQNKQMDERKHKRSDSIESVEDDEQSDQKMPEFNPNDVENELKLFSEVIRNSGIIRSVKRNGFVHLKVKNRREAIVLGSLLVQLKMIYPVLLRHDRHMGGGGGGSGGRLERIHEQLHVNFFGTSARCNDHRNVRHTKYPNTNMTASPSSSSKSYSTTSIIKMFTKPKSVRPNWLPKPDAEQVTPKIFASANSTPSVLHESLYGQNYSSTSKAKRKPNSNLIGR